MSSTRIQAGTGAVRISRERSFKGDEYTVIEVYSVPTESVDGFESGYNFGDSHPTYSFALLNRISVSEPPMGGRVANGASEDTAFDKVTLTYATASGADSGGGSERPPVGYATISSASAAQDIPIELHGSYDGVEVDPVSGISYPMIGQITKKGVEAFYVPSSQFTIVQTLHGSEYTFSATNNRKGLGTRQKPPYLEGGNSDDWMLIQRDPATNSDGTVTLTRTWLENEAGWDPDIYDRETTADHSNIVLAPTNG